MVVIFKRLLSKNGNMREMGINLSLCFSPGESYQYEITQQLQELIFTDVVEGRT
jgi:hypothetical protein